MKATRAILIVDDHSVVREGLRQILTRSKDICVAGEAANGEECLKRLCRDTYDLVVLDLHLQGMDGLETLRRIRSQYPSIPVLVFTMYSDERRAARALRLGAAGYVVKDESLETVLEAITKVLAGETFITPSMAGKLAKHLSNARKKDPLDTLSAREYQVMQMIVEGKRLTDIADQLGLNVKTVSTYKGRVLRKLGLFNVAALVRYMIENNAL
ncbi:MAG: response regulator [Kiritimatiellia bacterium]